MKHALSASIRTGETMSGRLQKIGPHQRLLLLGVFVLFATALRFALLDRRVYWHDEVFTSLRAAGYQAGEVIDTYYERAPFPAHQLGKYQQPSPDRTWADSIQSMARGDPHLPPAYFLASRAWMLLGGSSPGALRSLAVAIALLTLPATYWMALALFRRRSVALMALVLASVSPMFVLLAREARPYSLWTLMTLASSAAFVDAVRLRRLRNWAVYAILLVVGLNSHLFFSFVMFIHAVYLALSFFRLFGMNRPDGRTVSGYLLATIVGVLSFVPWLTLTASSAARAAGQVSWTATEVSFTFLVRIWAVRLSGVFVDFDFLSTGLQILFVGPVLLFALSALVFLWRKGPASARLFVVLLGSIPAATLVLPDLLLGGYRSAVARYLVPVFISLQMAAAFLLASKIESVRDGRRMAWQMLAGVIIALGIISSIFAVRAYAWWDKGSDYGFHEAASVVNSADRPLVVVGRFRTDLFGATVALANELEPHVYMLWTATVEPEEIRGFGPVFVFRPTPTLTDSIAGNGWRVQEVVPGLLWQVSGNDP
jgi:uncharacterized membrane protein